jgi:hypothetical protein
MEPKHKWECSAVVRAGDMRVRGRGFESRLREVCKNCVKKTMGGVGES